MLTANRILADLADKFKEYEVRLGIRNWLDSATIDDSQSVEQVFGRVCDDLVQVLGVDSAAMCLRTNAGLVPMSQGGTPGTRPDLNPDRVQEISSGRAVFVPKGLDPAIRNTLVVPCCFRSKGDLLLILQDDAPIPEASRLLDQDREFLSELASKLGSYLQAKVGRRMDAVKTRLITSFFENELKPRRCWALIVEHAASFLPEDGPLAVAPSPLVQILTCKKTDRYVILRATQGEYFPCRGNGERTALADVLPLRVDDTVCGLLVESDSDILYTNPRRDYPHRYKAYMYGAKIPESELVVGVRDKGELVALLNLEHMSPDVFEPYHISLLREAADFLAPFIGALLSRADRIHSKQVGLLYVITKLLKRMGSDYRHLTAKALVDSRGVMNAMKKEVQDKEGQLYQHVLELEACLKDFQVGSSSFLSEMPEYVNYGKVDLLAAIRDGVKDCDPEGLRGKDRIDIRVSESQGTILVFGSRMLKVHIYNVVNNAVEAIMDKRQKGFTGDGLIDISIHRSRIEDAQHKETSPARISVEIADNGGGIPEEAYSRVMDFGFSTKSAGPGRGYGLPAAREYMEEIGGGLELKNRQGEGLTVVLHLQEYDPDYHDRRLE